MENFDTTSCESIEVLEKFTNWVESFCVENNIVEYKDSEEYKTILYMSYEDILSLSGDECFSYAITLMNYAGILQKKHDVINAQYNWCNEALNFLYAKYWERYDKFLPAEIRKKSIIIENSFAQNIEKCRLRLKPVCRYYRRQVKKQRKEYHYFRI